MLDQASLEKKIVDLKDQLEQLKANANAVAGAIKFAEHLLAELTTPIKDTKD